MFRRTKMVQKIKKVVAGVVTLLTFASVGTFLPSSHTDASVVEAKTSVKAYHRSGGNVKGYTKKDGTKVSSTHRKGCSAKKHARK
jgi:energy-converting hydrogenase Eha subunit B